MVRDACAFFSPALITLFASVLAGGLARGENLKSMMELAGSFIEKAITDAVKEEIPRNDGVEYEKYLHMLMK